MDTRRARIILATLVSTFLITRVLLHQSPDSDFDVAGYNVHHLFTGLLMVTVGGLPLILFPGRSRLLDIAALLFAAGLALALDEWVYLIATDGSNASYLLPVSLWGGVFMIALAVAWIAVLYMAGRGRR